MRVARTEVGAQVIAQGLLELLVAGRAGVRRVGERPGQGGRCAGRAIEGAIPDPPGIELIDHASS
jgi:hypothetical protein